jgi:hypothetical protein
MVEDAKKTDDLAAMIEKIEMRTLPAAAAPRSMAAVQPVRRPIRSEPERLSKGQRRHIRRQKQAREPKAIDRRQ